MIELIHKYKLLLCYVDKSIAFGVALFQIPSFEALTAKTCSPGTYGRTVYIKNHGDLRFQTRIPQDSEQYKKIYNERGNDRVLNDYCLQHLKIRSKDHFSFETMLIGICIHLDARYKTSYL